MNPATEFLRDIRAPVSVPSWLPLWLLFFLLALLAIFVWARRSRKKITEVNSSETPLPAHQLALQKLGNALQVFERDGNMKLFFSEFSLIFRLYLSARYSLDAIEKTTSEIFFALRSSGIERSLCLEAKEILAFSDLVKFAKYQPIPSEISKQVEGLKRWIQTTQEVPEQVEATQR